MPGPTAAVVAEDLAPILPEHREGKLIGRAYYCTAYTGSDVIHRSPMCPRLNATTQVTEVPVIEDDGRLYALWDNLDRAVEWCMYGSCKNYTPDPRWRADALCQWHDPDIFFPEDTGPGGYDEGRSICAACPVQVECLDYAMVAYERHGVYGGTSPSKRGRTRKDYIEARWEAVGEIDEYDQEALEVLKGIQERVVFG